jgi:CRISPR-associated protein Cas2
MTQRRRFVVTYDITSDKRRDKVAKAMLDFGDRIQYSVFLCDLNDRERVRLRARLDPLVNHAEDQILTIDLGPAALDIDQTISSLGRDFALPTRAVVV